MTLLVLALRVPLREAIHSEVALAHSFLALAPRLLTYFLGMITLGIYWTGNATLLGLVERSERNFTWITIFFLFTIRPYRFRPPSWPSSSSSNSPWGSTGSTFSCWG